MNTNENVTVVNHARIDDARMSKMVCGYASDVAQGKADSLPDELADLFTLEIVTRPSGSRYAVLNFA